MTQPTTVYLPETLNEGDRAEVERLLAATGLPLWVDDLAPRNSPFDHAIGVLVELPDAALGAAVGLAIEGLWSAVKEAVRRGGRGAAPGVAIAVVRVITTDGREIDVRVPGAVLNREEVGTPLTAELRRLAADPTVASGTYVWDGNRHVRPAT